MEAKLAAEVKPLLAHIRVDNFLTKEAVSVTMMVRGE